MENGNPTPEATDVVVFPLIAYAMLPIYIILVLYRACAPRLPRGREVRTVAGTLRLFCGSHCVRDFAEVSMLKESEKRKKVLGWGRTYAFGIIRGVDGVARYGIDEAYLVRRIKPRRQAVVEWVLRMIGRRDSKRGFQSLEHQGELEGDVDRSIEMENGVGSPVVQRAEDASNEKGVVEQITRP
jgi:hypothetical protein